jgi:Outer membrane protein beta-barrel domain
MRKWHEFLYHLCYMLRLRIHISKKAMKNLFVVVSLFVSNFAFTQKLEQDEERKFRLGIIGGINLNSVDGRSFKNEYNFNYQLGGFILINPFTKVGFQPEVHFAQQSATYSNDLTDIYDDLALGGDQAQAKLSTLKFTGLVNFDIGPSQRVKLQIGPQYAIVINETTGVQGAAKDIFKKGDFSGVAGIWLQLPIVFIGARYAHGFSNLNDIDNRDTWKSRSFQIIAGVTF